MDRLGRHLGDRRARGDSGGQGGQHQALPSARADGRQQVEREGDDLHQQQPGEEDREGQERGGQGEQDVPQPGGPGRIGEECQPEADHDAHRDGGHPELDRVGHGAEDHVEHRPSVLDRVAEVAEQRPSQQRQVLQQRGPVEAVLLLQRRAGLLGGVPGSHQHERDRIARQQVEQQPGDRVRGPHHDRSVEQPSGRVPHLPSSRAAHTTTQPLLMSAISELSAARVDGGGRTRKPATTERHRCRPTQPHAVHGSRR